jgi:DNA-binding response OmpR family regulator
MNDSTQFHSVLIVDDDRELGEMLTEFLLPDGFALTACLSGEDGLAAIETGNYELVILDIMLPGMSGIEVLKRVRASSDIPVIMLTARGDDVDRILGLEFGADDYLTKPFNPRELRARLRAILRRSQPQPTTGSRLEIGSIELDSRARSVTVDGSSVRLTGTEFELLWRLALAPGDVVSKEVLSLEALGRRHMPYDRSIDTHISNVRGKLAAAGVTNPLIQARRGVGYCLVVDD